MKHYSAVTIDYEFFDECGSSIWFDSRVRRMKRKLTIIGIIKVSGISEFLIYHYQSKHHKALNGALSGQFASDFPAFFPHFISFNLIFWLDESDFQVLFRFNWARFDSLLHFYTICIEEAFSDQFMDVSSNQMGCFGLSKVELFGYIRYGYVNDHHLIWRQQSFNRAFSL